MKLEDFVENVNTATLLSDERRSINGLVVMASAQKIADKTAF